MQKKVEKKLLKLFTGELSATIIFALVWIEFLQLYRWTVPYLTSFSSLYAFALLEFILLQGSYYWFLKLKQTKRKDYSHLPYRQLKIFAVFRGFNLFLIGIGIIIMIYQLVVFPIEFFWFVFLYFFAIIEYINYYHIRLSYQSIDEIKELIRQKELRSSKLAKELKTFNNSQKNNNV
ncbi:hypothetical protein [Neobacillus massiliamazoniensis]|uniref:General stress protein n=1 Tax=Neobacillus massiliamazoniensis TaxID=1499688 RepID=A0A0U1P3V7_9BACI|nr:hypothetical protein [Neobacillus massiliamazoniensis]CRK84999.1 hypothetical protein BN000_05058 [Neobacillus massiliamazoniensis]